VIYIWTIHLGARAAMPCIERKKRHIMSTQIFKGGDNELYQKCVTVNFDRIFTHKYISMHENSKQCLFGSKSMV